MRVIVGHKPEANQSELRKSLLGSGLDCGYEDIVSWSNLSARLGQMDADLVLVGVDQEREEGWTAFQDAQALTSSPVVVVGSTTENEIIEKARTMGAAGMISETDFRTGLDVQVDQLMTEGQIQGQRGHVISVFAPLPGSGGTTIAMNLAGALAQKQRGKVALIEMARDFGDISMLLDITPEHSTADVFRRWQNLDRMSMSGCFTEHSSGVKVLANGGDDMDNPFMDADSVRRVAILSRMSMGCTVLALDNRYSENELEAMQLSDAIALVVRLDVPSVKRAKWAIDQAVSAGVPQDRFHLVINRHGIRGQLATQRAEQTIGMKAACLIPEDSKTITAGANFGRLVQQQGSVKRITRRFAKLAKLLTTPGK